MSDDDKANPPLSIKERTKLFEQRNLVINNREAEAAPPKPPRPAPGPRSITAPAATSTERRPPLDQFTRTSEEILQKTKSGFLDLTGKGIATFQQAGTSVNDFKDRLIGQKPRPAEPVPSVKEDEGEILLIDFEDDQNEDPIDERLSALSVRAPTPELVEANPKDDRMEVCLHTPYM